jgi:hypothetical protein
MSAIGIGHQLGGQFTHILIGSFGLTTILLRRTVYYVRRTNHV